MRTVLLVAAGVVVSIGALVLVLIAALEEPVEAQTVPGRVTDHYAIGDRPVFEFRDGLNRTCVMVGSAAGRAAQSVALSCDWPKKY